MGYRPQVGPDSGTETTNHYKKHDGRPICGLDISKGWPEDHRLADARHPPNCEGCLDGYLMERGVDPNAARLEMERAASRVRRKKRLVQVKARKPAPRTNDPPYKKNPHNVKSDHDYVPNRSVGGYYHVE